jgi:hypothetical protein
MAGGLVIRATSKPARPSGSVSTFGSHNHRKSSIAKASRVQPNMVVIQDIGPDSSASGQIAMPRADNSTTGCQIEIRAPQ